MTPKLPRDVSGRQLASALTVCGYQETRRTGSHMRLTTSRNGEHHVTVPAHDSLKVGTLSAILAEVADHLEVAKADLIDRLFPQPRVESRWAAGDAAVRGRRGAGTSCTTAS